MVTWEVAANIVNVGKGAFHPFSLGGKNENISYGSWNDWN